MRQKQTESKNKNTVLMILEIPKISSAEAQTLIKSVATEQRCGGIMQRKKSEKGDGE